MKKILLTGGFGFIGKNIYEGLCNEYKIFNPSHNELNILDQKAVRNYIKEYNIKTIIHTAIKGGDEVFESTLGMYLSIYNSIDLIEKFINFGSGAEYGKTRDIIKVKESELGLYMPEDKYGLSKLICSKLASNNKKIVTLLPFGIFGKYEGYEFKYISNTIVKNILNLPIVIKQNVVFDYLYISDILPIISGILKNNEIYGDVNLTPNKSIDLIKIADIVNKIGKNKTIIKVDNSGYNYQYTGNNSKLKSFFPDITFTSYEDSIKFLYDYYLSHIDCLSVTATIQDEYYKICKLKKS